ncbi:hypothetical protein PG984_014952 [Apiospora sp. TS-2023a]
MQPSESEVGLNGPSAEDTHSALEMRTLSRQPLTPEDEAFHGSIATYTTFSQDALPWFDEPSDQFQALTFPDPFSTAPPLDMHTPIDTHVETGMSATPTTSSNAEQEGLPGSPVASSPPDLERQGVKRICDGIPKEEASTMESIMRGDCIAFPVEDRPRDHLRPLAPYPTHPGPNMVTHDAPNFSPTFPFAGEPFPLQRLTTTPATDRMLSDDLTMAKLPSSPSRALGASSYEKLNVKSACNRCQFKKYKCDEGETMHKVQTPVSLESYQGFHAMGRLFSLCKIFNGQDYTKTEPKTNNRDSYEQIISREMVDEAFESISLVSESQDAMNVGQILSAQSLGLFHYTHKSHTFPILHLPTLLQIVGKDLKTESIPWYPVYLFKDSPEYQSSGPMRRELPDAAPLPPTGMSPKLLASGVESFLIAQLPMLLLSGSSSDEENAIFTLWKMQYIRIWSDFKRFVHSKTPGRANYQLAATMGSLYLICLMLKERWLSIASNFRSVCADAFEDMLRQSESSELPDLHSSIEREWLTCKEVLTDGGRLDFLLEYLHHWLGKHSPVIGEIPGHMVSFFYHVSLLCRLQPCWDKEKNEYVLPSHFFELPPENEPDHKPDRKRLDMTTHPELLVKMFDVFVKMLASDICNECKHFRFPSFAIQLMEDLRRNQHNMGSLAKPAEKQKRKRGDAAEPTRPENHPAPTAKECLGCRNPI